MADHKVIPEAIDEGPGLNEKGQEKLILRFAGLTARPTAGETSTGHRNFNCKTAPGCARKAGIRANRLLKDGTFLRLRYLSWS